MVHTLNKKRKGCLGRLITGLLTVCILILGLDYGTKKLFPMPYSPVVLSRSAENGISPALLYAVIRAESNFDTAAESKKGAKGLMQMMDETAVWCAEKSGLPLTDIEKPEENIALGAFYLGYLLKMYGGDETCAIAAYNAGHGRVDEWLRDTRYSADGKTLKKIPFSETEKYVKKVQFFKTIYEHRLK